MIRLRKVTVYVSPIDGHGTSPVAFRLPHGLEYIEPRRRIRCKIHYTEKCEDNRVVEGFFLIEIE
jgi:hypothetical protein